MSRWRQHRPSAALVIAIIALFLAMGGAGYAFSLARNSVGTAQLKDRAVTAAKIKDGAVTTSKLNRRATVANALRANVAQSATNSGSAYVINGVTYVHAGPFSNPVPLINRPGQASGQANCPSGMVATGGGVFGSGLAYQTVNSSGPVTANGSAFPNAWRATMNNTGATDETFDVYVICVRATGLALRSEGG